MWTQKDRRLQARGPAREGECCEGFLPSRGKESEPFWPWADRTTRMETKENRQFRLAARPVGLPKDTDWESTVEPIPSPEPGEVVVEVIYLSLDPAMRGWMNEGRSYIPPVGIGEVMRAVGIGRVIDSAAPGFAIGDYVTGAFGIQQFARIKASEVQKVDPNLAP